MGYFLSNHDTAFSPPHAKILTLVQKLPRSRDQPRPESTVRRARLTGLPEIGLFSLPTPKSLPSQSRDRTSHRPNCRGQQPIRQRPVPSRCPETHSRVFPTVASSTPHPRASGGCRSAMESPEFAAAMRSHGANGAGPNKRKRGTMDSSPASLLDHDQEIEQDVDHDERGDASPETKNRRLPGVKRACNECRQQKVRHFIPYIESPHAVPPTLSSAFRTTSRTPPGRSPEPLLHY